MSVVKQWENQDMKDIEFFDPGVLKRPWRTKKQDQQKSEDGMPAEDEKKYSWERPWPDGLKH